MHVNAWGLVCECVTRTHWYCLCVFECVYESCLMQGLKGLEHQRKTVHTSTFVIARKKKRRLMGVLACAWATTPNVKKTFCSSLKFLWFEAEEEGLRNWSHFNIWSLTTIKGISYCLFLHYETPKWRGFQNVVIFVLFALPNISYCIFQWFVWVNFF